MQPAQKRKAKRKLSNIDFSNEEAHLALCLKEQGVANDMPYQLVLKSKNYSPEFLEKASKVSLELDIVEYLERFFYVYGANAEILARSLGFTTKKQEKAVLEQQEKLLEDQEDMLDPEYPEWDASDEEYEMYINAKVASIDVMKALRDSEDIPEMLAKLQEEDYLQLIQDQQKIERVLKSIEDSSNSSAAEEAEEASATAEEEVEVVNTSVNKQRKTKKEQPMTVKVDPSTETIAKSEFLAIEKQFKEQAEVLQKALAQVEEFKKEKQELVEKQRFAEVKQVLKQEQQAEVIFKAIKNASDEDFAGVVKALGEIQAAVDNSELFVEKGASVDEDTVQELPVVKAFKARMAKKQ